VVAEPAGAQRENVETVREGIAAYVHAPDGPELLAFLADDVEIFLPAELGPNSGTFRGHDEYLEWVATWLDAWDDFTIEIADTEPVGERHVITTVRQTATGHGSGVPLEMTMFYMFEVRERQAAALHLYLSREDALSVAALRERGSAN
jgi:ketosteroid isomerase-like protein